ncbi:hypothetical protein HN587_03925 [Candidatus Woesearchaeota archaeon]|jgi:tRNA wybutosine-synthesizing protein 3|nr:hypothetical protein [Candidatus Woesearchaeota archaeon]
MTFENDKRNCMKKLVELDKSRKGSVDDRVKELVEYINSLDDYYTTSSCSGRIILLKVPESQKKHEFEWLLCSHELVDFSDVWTAVQDLNKLETGFPQELIWLRMEGHIIHVCARSVDHANKLLKIARGIGLKRSGIISIGARITVEIESAAHADCMIGRFGELLVGEKYLRLVVDELNCRLGKEFKKIQTLETEVKENIS